MNLKTPPSSSRLEQYAELLKQAEAMFAGERDFIANAANLAGLIYYTLPDLNWAGFYLFKGGELVLGPFQGKPACIRIKIGQGVCGYAAEMRKTVIVPDVHKFTGHIACDSASNSEIVVPLIKEGRLVGVMDVDSPMFNRFDEEDKRGLEKLGELLLEDSDI